MQHFVLCREVVLASSFGGYCDVYVTFGVSFVERSVLFTVVLAMHAACTSIIAIIIAIMLHVHL